MLLNYFCPIILQTIVLSFAICVVNIPLSKCYVIITCLKYVCDLFNFYCEMKKNLN